MRAKVSAAPALTPSPPPPRAFTATLDIPDAAKQQLLSLTPDTYIGNAEAQARALPKHLASLK